MTNLRKPTEREAFESHMQPKENGCIEWTGNIDGTGYGRFCFKRKIELAHRAAWRILRGEIPAGACLLHKCDNPPCVNPDHLFLGDRGDNARDMASKGRQWIQRNPARRLDTLICPLEKKPRGVGHGMAKLNDEAVLAIRARSAQGETAKQIAATYSCSRSLIYEVVSGRIWRHVGGLLKVKKYSGDLS